MTRLELAKLVEWSGTVQGRKRLQKLVFLLRSAGAPVEAKYKLHHYGPYSDEVAERTGELVRLGLLTEEFRATGYCYELSAKAREQLAAAEGVGSRSVADPLGDHRPLVERLIQEDLWVLELASTIAWFRYGGESWSAATTRAAAYKQQPPENEKVLEARDLAKEVEGSSWPGSLRREAAA